MEVVDFFIIEEKIGRENMVVRQVFTFVKYLSFLFSILNKISFLQNYSKPYTMKFIENQIFNSYNLYYT